MKLYLVQHAQATSKEEDSRRPLAMQGLDDIRKVAEYGAAHCAIIVDKVLHSGKLRAQQTADALASTMNLPAPEETDGLEPLADPSLWADRLAENEDDLMLVGHLPHMARLASFLLCKDADRGVVRFQMGGVVALERDDSFQWSLSWMIVPAIL